MKKTLLCLMVLALMLSVSFSAVADDQKMIIAGTARISIPADMASVELGASAKGQTVNEAQKLTDDIMSQVLIAVKNLGVEGKDIITSNYSVYSEVPYDEYGSIKQQDPIYNMTNIIHITLWDLDLVSQVIDNASTKAGANQIYGLTFGSSKQGDAYNEALEKAVEDAMSKAAVIAAATGKTLGELVEIETERDYGEYWGVGGAMEYSGDSMTKEAIVSGQTTVSASVTLTYYFK